MAGLKQCSECGEWKDKAEFYKDRHAKDGLCRRCKQCTSVSEKNKRAANPEKYKEYNRRYRQAHPEEAKERDKARYWNNREAELERDRLYRKANPEKAKNRSRLYRENNREAELERRRNWYYANREEILQRKREYRKKQPAEVRVKDKQARVRNPESRREIWRRYYYNHHEKNRARVRQWQKENPERHVLASHMRRARKAGNGGSYTPEEWQRLCDYYGNRCLACGQKRDLTVDHIVPVIKGGPNDISNLQPLCKPCNSSKHDKTIDYRPSIPAWVEAQRAGPRVKQLSFLDNQPTQAA